MQLTIEASDLQVGDTIVRYTKVGQALLFVESINREGLAILATGAGRILAGIGYGIDTKPTGRTLAYGPTDKVKVIR